MLPNFSIRGAQAEVGPLSERCRRYTYEFSNIGGRKQFGIHEKHLDATRFIMQHMFHEFTYIVFVGWERDRRCGPGFGLHTQGSRARDRFRGRSVASVNKDRPSACHTAAR
jgi:hypothetical protein